MCVHDILSTTVSVYGRFEMSNMAVTHFRRLFYVADILEPVVYQYGVIQLQDYCLNIIATSLSLRDYYLNIIATLISLWDNCLNKIATLMSLRDYYLNIIATLMSLRDYC